MFLHQKKKKKKTSFYVDYGRNSKWNDVISISPTDMYSMHIVLIECFFGTLIMF